MHIPEENVVNVVNKGRKCRVYYLRDGEMVEGGKVDDRENGNSENELSVSGMFSEVVVVLVQ